MPESDLDLLLRAARAAAEVATTFIGGDLDVREKEGDQGPVTAADIAVNEVLEDTLRTARPAYGWLSEESPHDPLRLTSPSTFIIDPIDGTRSFIDGSDTWAHSLAIAEAGEITAAVVYLPMRDKLYAAEKGGGAELNGSAIRTTSRAEIAGAQFLATKPNIDPKHWPEGVPPFHRSHRPSLAYRMCLVADGSFDGMLTFRDAWEWDIAAGTLIVAEAGGRATDRAGQEMRFNLPSALQNGVVAGGPAMWDSTMAALGHGPSV
ncbi:3'(2'),5'-bisphosphate nucleotidase CysQ [Roseivivax sp. THAF30]|uniref:inositol monophosphatase family protein n=1 Tax=Roseivivax sp. THAF30 TaxID=2587852 RepID=UPI0012691862|nr:3'(2'),5'-bisphosphate nucleotidase CysQ [Roseivivax sp. THAF30]QFT64759.1 Inositol-1-monophosphatase [Roseivivax sp. THAF30]